MTAYDRFDRVQPRLPEILTELAAPSVPDYTDDLLARTAASRQRPRWTFIERWFPMGVIARERVILPGVPWRAIALAAVLAAVIASALVIVASQRRVPPPFGLASNGALLHDAEGDIYIREALDAQPRVVIGGAADDFAPSFTRDGTRVTFLRLIEDQPAERNDRMALMIANADGSDIRQLTGPVVGPDWGDVSVDSRQMVLQLSVENRPGLYLLDLETGDVRPLRADIPSFAPNWRGPDGREIIFRSWVRDGNLWRVALQSIRPDGTAIRQLTPLSDDLEAFQHPQVSPDGRYVTYNGWAADGTFRIHRLEIDTGDIRVLPPGPGYAHHGFASFSPDGTQLLFHGISEENRVQVMVAPVDHTEQARPLGPQYPVIGDSAEVSQTFSPDGKIVIITQGHDRETRMVDPAVGGLGRVLPWDATGVPSWQRLP